MNRLHGCHFQSLTRTVSRVTEYINRDNAINDLKGRDPSQVWDTADVEVWVNELPSADVVNKTDLLGWLLAYHTKSFELKGRYPSHEVISWLVNDLSMYLFEDGEQDG